MGKKAKIDKFERQIEDLKYKIFELTTPKQIEPGTIGSYFERKNKKSNAYETAKQVNNIKNKIGFLQRKIIKLQVLL